MTVETKILAAQHALAVAEKPSTTWSERLMWRRRAEQLCREVKAETCV
ncbi:MAG TPA: hypothetical protein VIJ94_11360 [Caulobacteraceae bacterium]